MTTLRKYEPELLERARRGDLTRGNTSPGTLERQAVTRVEYLRRRELHPSETARHATGHYGPGRETTRMSVFIGGPPRFVIIEGLNRRDRSRAGRYGDLVHKLQRGDITEEEFRRRVRRWRPIAGESFLSDAEAVLAILDELRATDRETFVYDHASAA